MEDLYDITVIGLGGHGSSTFFHVAKNQYKVLGIEQYKIAHNLGSSHGDTRITRKLTFEDPVYYDLVESSFQVFEELSKLSKKQIFKKTGGLFMGTKDSNLVNQCLMINQVKGVPIQILCKDQITANFPHFEFENEDIIGVFDENAGVLFAENCIQAFIEEGLKINKDARIVENCKYLKHQKNEEDIFEIVTDIGKIKSKKIVFACGMWNVNIIKGVPFEIRKIQLFWFNVPPQIDLGMQKCPIFMYEVSKNPMYYVYGFPNVQNQGIKLGFSPNQHCKIIENPNFPTRSVDTFEKVRMKHILQEFFPCISKENVIDEKECFVTLTPDENFVIDFDQEDKNIIYISPCSGHGFKYTGGVGKLVSEMVENQKVYYDLFRIKRFEGSQYKGKRWGDSFIKFDEGFDQKNRFRKYFNNNNNNRPSL
ncbi:sarcosine oxidase, putative [Ichthyophthirius multifiliis]|uniref:Sarcosine oxidase, putative n=1 Tax=Ichthyophthirius multifiliis TaxID=5932 RepID=G0QWT3_ICHMU|nr:sarcosine oxidase, putative [Ichthyophthirius multifiliis]EGR30322.1 sarcosine oxidase, putative [Ichthyophthirius multifiliis]|eukprot:XP_004031909.1 sarcosine oxidase, putative [Ichthyophthirius multifiliis]